MAFLSRRDHDSVLAAAARRVREAGPAAYGPLAVDEDALRAHVARVLEREGGPAVIQHAADLFLACAADREVPGAWEILLRVHGDSVRRMLRSRGVPDTTARDVVDALPGTLVVEPGTAGGRTRLATYDGSGSLRSWLGIVAMRAVIAERRRAERHERAVAQCATVEPTSVDAASHAGDSELGARLAQHLRDAWVALPPRWRLALALRYVQGLQGVEIARLLGVGAPRVTRIVESAVAKLRASLEVEATRPTAPSPATLRTVLAAELARLAAVELPLSCGSDPAAPG